MKLMLTSVFSSLFGATVWPEAAMFKRFQQRCLYLDQETYDIATNSVLYAHTGGSVNENGEILQRGFIGVRPIGL